MEDRKARLMTGTFAVGEVFAGLRNSHAAKLRSAAREFFSSGQVEVLPFDMATAEICGSVRSQTSVSALDAIHIATAAHVGVDLFVTNGKKLQKISIPGIRSIAGPDGKLW
jgi:predicted nucleic acid-binding protein